MAGENDRPPPGQPIGKDDVRQTGAVVDVDDVGPALPQDRSQTPDGGNVVACETAQCENGNLLPAEFGRQRAFPAEAYHPRLEAEPLQFARQMHDDSLRAACPQFREYDGNTADRPFRQAASFHNLSFRLGGFRHARGSHPAMRCDKLIEACARPFLLRLSVAALSPQRWEHLPGPSGDSSPLARNRPARPATTTGTRCRSR